MLKRIDGFDWWNNSQINANAASKYSKAQVTFFQGAATAGRFSGSAFQLVNTAFGFADFLEQVGGTTFCGMAVKLPQMTGLPDDIVFLVARQGATGIASVSLRSNGDLSVYQGGAGTNSNRGSSIGRITPALNATTFVFVELVVSNSVIQVWIDDVLRFEQVGSYAAADRAGFRWENFGTLAPILDDFYLADDTGAQNNTRLGPVRVQTLLPIGDGAISGWMRSSGADDFSRVAGVILGSPQGYLESPSGGALDLFVFPSPSPCGGLNGLGRILGIGVNAAARSLAGVGSLDLMCQAFPGSSVPSGVGVGAVLADPSKYSNYQGITEINLRTGAWPWTAADVGAAWWGPQSTSVPIRVAQFNLECLATLRSGVPVDCPGSAGAFSYVYGA